MEAAHLLEYLKYMDQLGFSGLALEQNPFAGQVAGAGHAAPPPRPPGLGAPAAKKKAEPPKPKATGPNLFDIMANVNMTMETGTGSNGIQDRVNAVGGDSKVEVLRNLYKEFRNCEGCALGTTRGRFVFGEGSPEAELFIVGDGPGDEENRTGRPFMGQAGQLLTRILQAMEINRSDVFITNVVKCRPPGDRALMPDEVSTCSPMLVRQIETVKPKAILALGPVAYKQFKGGNVSMMRGRGQLFEWRGIPVMPTFHPSYILRNPRAKREVWEDMKKVMALLRGE